MAQLQNPLKRKCEIWVIINSEKTVGIIVSYLLHLRCKSIAPVYCTIICSDISSRYKSRVVIICSKIKEHSEDVEVNDVFLKESLDVLIKFRAFMYSANTEQRTKSETSSRILNGPVSKFGTPVSKKNLSPKQPCIFSAVNVCLFVFLCYQM